MSGAGGRRALVDVHVVTLAPSAARLDTLLATLDRDERERARRYRRQGPRRRFVASRGALRELLGARLDVAPAAVRLLADDRGRPRLAPDHDATLEFSVSRAVDLALVAIGRAGPLGVDIERLDAPGPDGDACADAYADADVDADVDVDALVAQRFLPPGRAAELARLPAAARARAFLRAWTRLEAWLKAVGTGFAACGGPHDIEAALGPGGTHRAFGLAVGDDHVATLVTALAVDAVALHDAPSTRDAADAVDAARPTACRSVRP